MKVILLQDIKSVGKKDQLIEASDGYARNYLFPRKLAVEANNTNLSLLKGKKASEQHKKDIEMQKANKFKKELESKTIEIKTNVGENGKIFGSITSKQISEELEKQFKIQVDKKKIILDEPIKNSGAYTVQAKLYEGIHCSLKINVK